jgi:glycosyltransferase involved in cell wall biosynthesis
MDIALILNYSKTRTTGGPTGVAYNTVEGLKKNSRRLEKEDIHIHILSTAGTSLKPVYEKDEAYSTISFEYFRQLVPASLFSDVHYYLLMKKMKGRIDLLHSHDVSGAVVGTFLNIPTILTLHGMIWKEKYYSPDLYSRFASAMKIRRFRYVSGRLKKLIAISPYVIDEMGQFLKTAIPDTEVIENPLSDAFFEQEKREKEGLILYPASIYSLKNQHMLVEALYRVKKEHSMFHCVLAGPVVDTGYYRDLKTLIHTYNLEKNISLAGNASLDQMLALYAEASIMAMTSCQETAPLVIAEAMATGTPVIASRISGIPAMVSENTSGFLINPKDPEDIAHKIITLLDDRPLRKKFGEESRRIAASRWKNDVIINKLINVYTQVSV